MMVILLFIFATLILSVIVGLFCTLSVSPSKKNQVQGFDLFTDVCIGSFAGGIVGGIIGLIISYIIFALTPESDGMFIGLVAFAYLPAFYISATIFVLLWLVGIFAGASKAIRDSLN